jgi:P-type Ca2+ transporter type 2C
MAMRGEVEATPLQVQLNDLADFIAKGGLFLAVFLFFALVVKHYRDEDILSQLSEFLIAAITVVVVAVPEGLPMAVTMALAFATNRMLQDNNLVRVLASCETMGRVTTICSDKTGTLTENRMTVVKCSVDFDSKAADEETELTKLINEGLAVNSTAFEIENSETGQFEFVGSATEAALLRFMKASPLSGSYVLLRRRVPLKKVLPFSSARKLMISVTETGRIHLKGAAELVLARCNRIMKETGEIVELGDGELRRIKRFLNEMNTDALRSIGQAFSQDSDSKIAENADNENVDDEALLSKCNFIWLAAFGIEDPLRIGVKEAVKMCQSAGIFVRMVTGDCRETAESIARRCGILMRGGLIMEGPEFRSLSDGVLEGKLPKLQVLARSSPLDKQRLVRLLKGPQLNEIVAVTGDGSNDGPALKAADVGFSMGITGTQLAQEASAIVLLDDNFASIVRAASWGRCITRSVRKFLQFQLTVNVGAVGTALITALGSGVSVLTAIQMLWVNLLMDSLGALALATDLPTADLLQVPPERPGSPLINALMAWQIGTQAALQLILCLGFFYGNPLVISDVRILRTFIFNLFVHLQLFNELNCRAISGHWRVDLEQVFEVSNWLFWLIWIGSVVLQFGIVQFGGVVFGTVPLGFRLWLWSVGLAVVSIPLGIFVRVMMVGSKTICPDQEALHPTREQLAWQSAIHHVRARARFYSAIRRRQSLSKEVLKSETSVSSSVASLSLKEG